MTVDFSRRTKLYGVSYSHNLSARIEENPHKITISITNLQAEI
jgi:hypothetical protein